MVRLIHQPHQAKTKIASPHARAYRPHNIAKRMPAIGLQFPPGPTQTHPAFILLYPFDLALVHQASPRSMARLHLLPQGTAIRAALAGRTPVAWSIGSRRSCLKRSLQQTLNRPRRCRTVGNVSSFFIQA